MENQTSTENQIIDELLNTIEKVENGDFSHLDAVIKMREKKTLLDQALETIKEFEQENREEIELQAKDNNNEYMGYKFEIRNGRKAFSFKEIPEWQQVDSQKKAIEKKYKAMLEAKISGSEYANVTPDGEELPLPEINYAKGSIVVKALRR